MLFNVNIKKNKSNFDHDKYHGHQFYPVPGVDGGELRLRICQQCRGAAPSSSWALLDAFDSCLK